MMAKLSQCQSCSNCSPSHLLTLKSTPFGLENWICRSLQCVTLLGQMHSVCAVVPVLVPFCRSLLSNLAMHAGLRYVLAGYAFWTCQSCSGRLLTTASCTSSQGCHIRFSSGSTGTQTHCKLPCHPAHLLTHNDATLLHHLSIHGACCMTANISKCMSNAA